jgi:hypothetical protein
MVELTATSHASNPMETELAIRKLHYHRSRTADSWGGRGGRSAGSQDFFARSKKGDPKRDDNCDLSDAHLYDCDIEVLGDYPLSD